MGTLDSPFSPCLWTDKKIIICLKPPEEGKKVLVTWSKSLKTRTISGCVHWALCFLPQPDAVPCSEPWCLLLLCETVFPELKGRASCEHHAALFSLLWCVQQPDAADTALWHNSPWTKDALWAHVFKKKSTKDTLPTETQALLWISHMNSCDVTVSTAVSPCGAIRVLYAAVVV